MAAMVKPKVPVGRVHFMPPGRSNDGLYRRRETRRQSQARIAWSSTTKRESPNRRAAYQVALTDHATAAAAAQPLARFRERADWTDIPKMTNQGKATCIDEESPTSMRRVNSEE
jgi:hypothetical protein